MVEPLEWFNNFNEKIPVAGGMPWWCLICQSSQRPKVYKPVSTDDDKRPLLWVAMTSLANAKCILKCSAVKCRINMLALEN